jgi:uncharacterized membrane-anchored protein
LAFCTQKNKESKTTISVHTKFNEEQLLFTFEGAMGVSVMIILLSIIEAYFKKNKKQKGKVVYGK